MGLFYQFDPFKPPPILVLAQEMKPDPRRVVANCESRTGLWEPLTSKAIIERLGTTPVGKPRDDFQTRLFDCHVPNLRTATMKPA